MFRYLLIVVMLCSCAMCFNYAFYYNENSQQISIFNYNALSNNNNNVDSSSSFLSISKPSSSSSDNSFPLTAYQTDFNSSTLLTEDNLINSYSSKVKDGTFHIEYYSLYIDSTEINLLNISYYASNTYFHDILFELPSHVESDKASLYYPSNAVVSNEMKVIQCKQCSSDGSKLLKKSISDIYGFEFMSNGSNTVIEKVVLVAKDYKKKKVTYYADVTSLLYEQTSGKSDKRKFYFYLMNLPFNFDLHFTINILNNNTNSDDSSNANTNTNMNNDNTYSDKKVLLIHQNIEYPNYTVEKPNPNYTMFIATISISSIAMLMSIIAIIVKNTLN